MADKQQRSMNSYAVKISENKTQALKNSASQGSGPQKSMVQFKDHRAESAVQRKLQEMANNNTSRIVQSKNTPDSLKHTSHGALAEGSQSDDLLSRGKAGKLKDGEVELMHRPDVGPMNLPALEQSLKSIGNASSRPVAEALDSKSASIREGKVQMAGIEDSSSPAAIARQVNQLRPQMTRIERGSGDNFEVQAKLNPWVKVLTGKVVPDLEPPQGECEDDTPHQREPGVVWRNEHSEDQPLRQYGDQDTYGTFMQYLEEVDEAQLDPDEKENSIQKQQLKTRLLSEFHLHLKTLPVSEIHEFGKQLESSIKTHEEDDSLDKAYDENRAIYRSWHKPKRISESTDLGAMVKGGEELVGADSLNVSLDPKRFREHKSRTKVEGSGLAPIGAVPSSMLYSGQKNTVFNKDRGTATALLPENLYAGFSAYNETVKSLLRGKSPEELDKETVALGSHAKEMRAGVTRPVFYNKEDIQSSTGAYQHDEKPDGPHVRKTHFDLGTDHNPLRESLDEKLRDPLRSNAIFYQTFTEHSKASPFADEWNEMVVKYRATGHTAGLHENIREWVPGLQPHDEIDDQLIDSGKFDANFAKTTEKWAKKPLKGEDFDPKKVTKKKRRGK